MKLLIINYSDALGGSGRAAFRIHFSSYIPGIQPLMVVKHKKSKIDNVIEIDKFKKTSLIRSLYRYFVIKIKNKSQQSHWRKYTIRQDSYLSDLRSDSVKITKQKIEFDIIQLHWLNERYFNLNELKKISKPIVWTLHDSWPFTGICHYFYDCEKYKSACGACPFLNSSDQNDLSRKIWKKKEKIYSFLDLHIIAPSKWMAEIARQSKLLSEFPITIIPNGIDTTIFSPGEKEKACIGLKLKLNKRYILFSAMKVISDINKGFKELKHALRFLNYKNDIELLIIGNIENEKLLDINFPYKYLGKIDLEDNMINIYRAADVTVVPSLSENLSSTIMESLSCGTPVVAFKVGGNSDMIEHKRNGYLASAFSTEDFSLGIQWCLQNNQEGKLSDYAREKVVNNFSIEKVSKQYEDLYNSICHFE